MIGQQMQSMQKQLQLMKQHLVELDAAKQAVEDISKTEKGTEMLLPVTSGIFVKGELKDSKNFIVNVGAGTAVAKTAEDSKKLLEEQKIHINKAEMQINLELQRLSQTAAAFEKELAELSK